MKFFLDTAHVPDIRERVSLGLCDGVTTNPSLLAKEKDGPLTRIEFGPLTYDQGERSARLDGQAVDFSARELALLEILLLRAELHPIIRRR
mgnify:CR=1 FL=1